MKVRRIDWYAEDWLAGTSRLTAIQIACYITLINLQIIEGGPLERDDAHLAHILRLRKSVVTRSVDVLIMHRKLHENASTLSCSRVEDELKRSRERIESASTSASNRWKNNETPHAIASRRARTRAGSNHQPASEKSSTEPFIGDGVEDFSARDARAGDPDGPRSPPRQQPQDQPTTSDQPFEPCTAEQAAAIIAKYRIGIPRMPLDNSNLSIEERQNLADQWTHQLAQDTNPNDQ